MGVAVEGKNEGGSEQMGREPGESSLRGRGRTQGRGPDVAHQEEHPGPSTLVNTWLI